MASLFPYTSVAAKVTAAGRSDDQLQRGADSLARNFGSIVVRLRYCAAGLLLAGFLTFSQRRRIQTWIEEAVLPLPQFLRSVVKSLVRGLRADGRLNIFVLLILTLLGAALRVRFLFGPMSTDEAETFVSYASRPLYLGLSWYPAPNNHLFHTLWVHFSWLLCGEQEWAIRLSALIAGILLIPLIYWAARLLYDKHSALITAGFVATASTLIYYSSVGRGYNRPGCSGPSLPLSVFTPYRSCCMAQARPRFGS